MIRGTHHLTFCVGGAQEDYDFHVRLLGLRSVKKTVLFDGEIPIYHLYYANRIGDLSTILTSFPYRQAGWMGRRGTNQLRTINVVRARRLARLLGRPAARRPASRSRRPSASARSGSTSPIRAASRTRSSARPRPDDRKPWDGSDVPLEHAIRGAYGTTTSVREPEPMDDFLRRGVRAPSTSAPTGPHHQYRIGTDEGGGRQIELVEEPDLPQGSWSFGEGTIHHHAFDAGTAENQAASKDWIVGLGYTDVSDVKDRGYFHSVYMRTPGGALFELAYSDAAGLHDRRGRGGARHAHVHPAALGGPARRDLPARADRHRGDGRRLKPAPRGPAGARWGRRSRGRGASRVVVHGRDQDPAYMLEHLVAPARQLPDVAYVLPAAAGGSWYPGRFNEPRAANEPRLGQALEALEARSRARRRAAGAARARRLLPGRLPRGRPASRAAARLRGRGGAHRRADRIRGATLRGRAARRRARCSWRPAATTSGWRSSTSRRRRGRSRRRGRAWSSRSSDDREHRIRDAAVAGVRALLALSR